MWAGTSLFSVVLYIRVPIVLCLSHSLFPVYTGKHLYDKYMNNEAYENKGIQLCSVVYLWVPFVQDFCSHERYENYDI